MTSLVLALVVWAPADSPDEVGQLIANLGSEKWHVREHATRELVRRGDAILPALQAAHDSHNPEVRLRAAEIQNKLDARRMLAAVRLVDSSFADFPYIDGMWYNVEKKRYDDKVNLVVWWYARVFRTFLTAEYTNRPIPKTSVLYQDRRSYAEYRRASRQLAIYAVYHGVPIVTLKEMFAIMHANDAAWLPSSTQPPPAYVPPLRDDNLSKE